MHLRFSNSCSEEARFNRQVLEKESEPEIRNNANVMADLTMETASLNLESDDSFYMDLDDKFDYAKVNVIDYQDDDSWGLGIDSEDEDIDESDPARRHLIQFRKYVRTVRDDMLPFTKHEVASIELMDTLRKKKATLDTYEAVFEWHLRQTGKLPEWSPLETGTNDYHSRFAMIKRLASRYNVNPKELFKQRKIILPSSGAKINLIYHDARDLFVDLLTDPRHSDDDFLFFDEDPFAPPPENLDYVSDVNTGLSYTETYKKLITKPGKQILVGNILYTDGLVTGQFDKLHIEEVKYTTTLLTKDARNLRHGWRQLCLVPTYSKADSRGKKLLAETNHAAAHLLPVDDEEGVGGGGNSDDDSVQDEDEAYGEWEYASGSAMEKAQDYHRILAAALSSVRKLEKDGLVFDLKYRGKLYRNVEFVFFTSFIKCDGDEADKLCAHYRSRGDKVANICRYCTIPTSLCDAHVLPSNVYMKEWEWIRDLVEDNDDDGLKAISQQNIKNALHDLVFGLHNKQGVHGACPMEMLHMILLGIFKYMRDGFFHQLGHKSKTTGEINALAKVLGRFFKRQSDRDLPKTHFSKGIVEGKIMGKEFTGVILLMATILQTDLGRSMLLKSRSRHFKEAHLLDDWALLLETVLQWEAFLKLDRMQKFHLKRLEKKHQYLMYLIKSICNRSEGLGFKIMKFHGIHHLCQDILNFGVPSVVDTGCNESHHKTTKQCAKLTQKDVTVFEMQTAKRVMEMHLLDLAMCEIAGLKKYEYFCLDQTRGPIDPKEQDPGITDKTITGGAEIQVFWDDDKDEVGWKMSKDQPNAWECSITDFLFSLQMHLSLLPCGVKTLCIRTLHKRNGQLFRGHPNYNKRGQWNDWCMVDWGAGYGQLPAEIWCFVDLSMLDPNFSTEFAGCHIQKGVFAVVESARYDLLPNGQPNTKSELFLPLFKEVSELDNDGDIAHRKFYLADVEAIVDCACVVPDIGRNKLRYLEVKPKKEWADLFIEWLERPHTHDAAMMRE